MNVTEGKMYICSMAHRYKIQTGLPVNIWIDEAGWYKKAGHSKRIKFQLDYANKVGGHPDASMKLDGEVVEETYDKNISEISQKDINEVSNFVKNNAYALDKAADEDIKMYQFDEIFIKGGKPATQEQLDELRKKVDEFMKISNEEDKKC